MTNDEAIRIEAGAVYHYSYRVAIYRAGPTAKYKGAILGYIPEHPDDAGRAVISEFDAPNDATAYARLLAEFEPEDARRLQSGRNLEFARRGPFKVPTDAS
jgi:hypothetical protein